MRKLVVKILLTFILLSMVFVLSGCTLTLETTENSVSASVDGETTERVDSIIDWIKDRVSRFFNGSETKQTVEKSGSEII